MSVNELAAVVFLLLGVAQILFAPKVGRWSGAAAKWFYERVLPRYVDPEKAARSARTSGALFLAFALYVWWQTGW